MSANRGYRGVNRAAAPMEGVIGAREHHLARLIGQRSPSIIPTEGLWAHFKAGVGVTESGGRVTGVASLFGSITAAPVASNGPYTDGAINGIPAWRYAGGETLRTTTTISLTDWSIYLVAQPDIGAQAYERLMDHNFTAGFWWGRNNTAANSWGGGVKETSGTYGRFVTASDGAAHVLGNFRVATTHSLWRNGVEGVAGTVTGAATTSAAIGIGCWHDDSSTHQRLTGGSIGEVLIYTVAHDAAQRAAIMAELMADWGIA